MDWPVRKVWGVDELSQFQTQPKKTESLIEARRTENERVNLVLRRKGVPGHYESDPLLDANVDSEMASNFPNLEHSPS